MSYAFKLAELLKQTTKALIMVSSSAGKFDKIRREIKAIKGVREALMVVGRADVTVFVEGSLQGINRAAESIFETREVVAMDNEEVD